MDELEGKWRDPWVNPDVEVLGKEEWEWFREAFPEGAESTCIIYGSYTNVYSHIRGLPR